MVKLLAFLKRKPGMSLADFRHYYENNHRHVGERTLPGMKRYVRRYLEAIPESLIGPCPDLNFDVITELWFEDRAAFEAALAYAAQPDVYKLIADDEENLFDRGKTVFRLVDEVESSLAQAAVDQRA